MVDDVESWEAASMHILLRKLTALHRLSDEEQTALLNALSAPRELGRGRDIVKDGTTPGQTTVMLAGTACRYKTLPNGKRHILAFQFPGDMTDLYSYVLERMDHAIGTLSPCTFAHIPHEKIEELRIKFPNLGIAFWRDTMVDASIAHVWASGSARNTISRVAYMFCEIYARLEQVGKAEPGMPLDFNATQQDLADALGLSLVHTNKTIAQLKTKGLIGRTDTKVVILNWDKLQDIAGFDPAYLHFRNNLRDGGLRHIAGAAA